MDRVIVATDFSTRSDRALRRATLIAKHSGASLTLVHVVDADQSRAMMEAERAAALSLLTETVRTMQAADGLAVDAQVKVDDICTGILGAAEEAGAQLIIVGPNRGRLRDVFTGTTAERMLRQTRRPLLVAIQPPSASYARTLLALDFDTASRVAASAAVSMELFEHTSVVGMHAFHTPARGMMQRAMAMPDAISDYVDSEGREAGKRLGALVAELGLPGMRQRVVAIESSVAGSILDCAQQENADLIVLGSNDRKGFARMLIGSVAEGVLRDARRDILIVPVDREAAA